MINIAGMARNQVVALKNAYYLMMMAGKVYGYPFQYYKERVDWLTEQLGANHD